MHFGSDGCRCEGTGGLGIHMHRCGNLTRGGRCGILGSVMRHRRIVTFAILVLWVLLGPVGMALSGCMMMDGCDALCSVPSVVPMVAIDPSVPPAASDLGMGGWISVPHNVWTVLDSPPKPASILL